DRALQEWFIENNAPAPEELRALCQALRGPRQASVWMTADDLSLATGLIEVKVKVGLAQLETAGAVQRLGDEGSRMLLRLGPWDEAVVQEATAGVEERRRHRRAQLAQMVTYAESNACRRRILLDHFGDQSPTEAPRCCDNCLAQQPTTVCSLPTDVSSLSQTERTALIILDALRRLKWEVGRGKLAQLLKGSRAKEMQQFGYDQSPYYGRLAVLSLKEIEDPIGQLIASGYFKVIGGNRPVLRLTPQGQAALRARASIPLRLSRTVRPEAVARKQAEREVGGTVALTAQMFAQGLTLAQIATQRELSQDTIYSHLARLIGGGKLPLSAVVAEEVVAQVRSAIAQVGDISALAPIKALLPDSISYSQIRCVVEAWRREHETNAIVAFLARPHPRPLSGPWHVGWALGFHSRFAGADWSRSPVGELAHRLKYQGDPSALPPLVEQFLTLCAEHPELTDVDAIVPVPPSTPRAFDPVSALAEALGWRLERPVWPVLVKTRRTAPQKELRTLAQKRANVASAFAVQSDVRGKRLLILDDLYDSGATLEELSRVLRQAGAARLCVLTLTRTIHADA
ncbi:MAG: helix-turn-helix domain-containing protein, partial [Chloroflexi bacterium]|nr:helix-turn-helix domain-containing protein [Chloroflexota bacterium]